MPRHCCPTFRHGDVDAVYDAVDLMLWCCTVKGNSDKFADYALFYDLLLTGFLFFKGVNAANEAAERQDRMDGYIK